MSMSKTTSTLLVGGTGKSLGALARRLRQAGAPFLLTSRRGQAGAPPGMRAARFEWTDRSSWPEPFAATSISAVVMTAPAGNEPATVMNPFIDFAKAQGVSRFVLIAGLSVVKGGPWLGQVYQHLDDAGVEYSVLRPMWFMDNLLEEPHLGSLRSEGRIYSGNGDGRAPWIASQDIAEVAFRALSSPTPPEEQYSIVGPASITMDQMASALTKVLGRSIEHVSLSDEDNAQRLARTGMPDFFKALVARLEKLTKAGEFDYRGPNDVERVTGRAPISFEAWAEANKAAWS